jgi:hypothetical protein
MMVGAMDGRAMGKLSLRCFLWMKVRLGGVGSRKIEAFGDGSALNLPAEMMKVARQLKTSKNSEERSNLQESRQSNSSTSC